MYLDINNLYGWAMSQYHSTGGFKWLSEGEINNTNLGKYTEESYRGLILEVDLDYPEQLHQSHDDFPLTAEKNYLSQGMVSSYWERIRQKCNISIVQLS